MKVDMYTLTQSVEFKQMTVMVLKIASSGYNIIIKFDSFNKSFCGYYQIFDVTTVGFSNRKPLYVAYFYPNFFYNWRCMIKLQCVCGLVVSC